MSELVHRDESFLIVGAGMEVWNTLGHGFLESVYEKALVVELEERGLAVAKQIPIPVTYKGRPVGNFIADIIVNDSIIVELKAVDRISQAHIAQGLNYLKATGLRLAIILNFAKDRLESKRLVM